MHADVTQDNYSIKAEGERDQYGGKISIFHLK